MLLDSCCSGGLRPPMLYDLAPIEAPLVALEPIFKKLAEFGFISFEEEGILIHKFPVEFFPSEKFIRNLASMG